MGLLDFLFGKTIKIDDPFFGEMKFQKFRKNPENNYLECRRHFKPIDDIIEIGINADVNDVLASQKELYKSIESNYDEVISSIIPLIEAEFKNWKEDFRINDFFKEFRAVNIFMPKWESTPKQWEIAYSSIHDPNHLFTLTMKGFKALEISIDG